VKKLTKKESKLPINEQNISVILGFIFVLVIGFLLYRYFSRKGEIKEAGKSEQITQTQETRKKEKGKIQLPTRYTVQTGDNLWKIAEKFYRSGYNWVDIARENRLEDASKIAVGQELTIPNVEPKKLTVNSKSNTDIGKTISPGKYTVQKGDWLSKIALRAYGDMFAWEKIYKANRDIIGPNPNIIKPGQVLTIPE
jgi:nucleoid-associated protein YgaU